VNFLFLGPGYPGVEGPSAGSGIGTYLREITQGLTTAGHSCHVLVWGKAEGRREQTVDGVVVHLQPRGYWRVIERFWPESRNVYCRGKVAKKLDSGHRFDWIEIESDEGIDIGVQRRLPEKTILRVHTTLAQMVEHKQVPVTATVRRNLARERRSIAIAPRILTHSALHAGELRARFAPRGDMQVVPHGIDLPANGHRETVGPPPGAARFVVVGTPDRRKGFDRIRPVLESYARRHGPCQAVIISRAEPEARNGFGLGVSVPAGVEVTWRCGISRDELLMEYQRATALLHLARYESFGLPLVEAAAVGTPVITTRVGVAPELLSGPVQKFLVDGDAPDACADALAPAARMREGIGADLARVVRERFSRRTMVDALLAVLASWGGSSKR